METISPSMDSARPRASSVLPTAVGPTMTTLGLGQAMG